MEANIEEVLRVSHLMPVIDEAHFAFSPGDADEEPTGNA